MNELIAGLKHYFLNSTGIQPDFMAIAPGRINLIGEHIDYNEGWVLPAAISYYVAAAIGANSGACLVEARWDGRTYSPEQAPVPGDPTWAPYVYGMYQLLRHKGMKYRPFRLIFEGNIPPGAGLSSSAALSSCLGEIFAAWHEYSITRQELIELAQRNEHEYIGVRCGIMDMFASVRGEKDHALLLDCRTLTYESIPLELTNVAFFLMDTRVKHALVDSAYNERRQQCEAAVHLFSQVEPQIHSLRDVSEDFFHAHQHLLPEVVRRRAGFVVAEIHRVPLAAGHLRANRWKEFGQCMWQTHQGLAQEYEVSCPEADFLVESAARLPGVLGARMMGGGFGGCVLILAQRDVISPTAEQLSAAYQKQFAKPPGIYQFAISNGCQLIEPN